MNGVDEFADRPDFRNRIDRNRDVVIILDIHHDIEDRHRIHLKIGDKVGVARQLTPLWFKGSRSEQIL